jgi:hypothetical protein
MINLFNEAITLKSVYNFIDDSSVDRNRVIFNMLQWHSPNSRE